MKKVSDFSHGEEMANSVTHGVGLGLSIAALVLLIVRSVKYGSAWHVVGFTIYGSTLILMFLASTLLHSFPKGKAKAVFEVMDHSMIYVFIAGTYTAVIFSILRNTLGWILFGVIWGIALIGVVFKAYFVDRYVYFSTGVYIVMGWLIIFFVKDLLANVGVKGFVFFASGGVAYSLGTLFYMWKLFKYHHAVWHIFVIAGGVLHFLGVIFYLV